MLKVFTYIFYLGIITSLWGGIGLKIGFVDENLAALFGITGIMATGIGYAVRNYLIKKKKIDEGTYKTRKQSKK